MTPAEQYAADMERLGPCTVCGDAPGQMVPQLCFQCWKDDHPAFTPWHKRRTVRKRIVYSVIAFIMIVLWCMIIGELT